MSGVLWAAIDGSDNIRESPNLPYARVPLYTGSFRRYHTISTDSHFYRAFKDAYGAPQYGDPLRKTAAERFGNLAQATTATDRMYYAPLIDKMGEKYARAKRVTYDQVRERRESPIYEKNLLNSKTYRYKYYNYNLPKPIYTDKSFMYN